MAEADTKVPPPPHRISKVSRGRLGLCLGLAGALAGCTSEVRLLASDQPQTAPDGPTDPRAPRYADNYYQIAQGGRYFTWYGCGGCHGTAARGVLDLQDGHWRHGGSLDRIYRFIAAGHRPPSPSYAARIPTEQIWQIAGFVQDLARNDRTKNRRNAMDQQGEPQGATWQGPLR